MCAQFLLVIKFVWVHYNSAFMFLVYLGFLRTNSLLTFRANSLTGLVWFVNQSCRIFVSVKLVLERKKKKKKRKM